MQKRRQTWFDVVKFPAIGDLGGVVKKQKKSKSWTEIQPDSEIQNVIASSIIFRKDFVITTLPFAMLYTWGIIRRAVLHMSPMKIH